MSFKRTSRLFASAAVTAGLAFGGLALTAPSASAATASATATYTCTSPLAGTLPAPLNVLGSFKVPATFSFDTLPSVLTANVPIPAGTPVVGTFQLPTASGGLAGILQSVGITLQSILGPTPLNVVSSQVNNGLQTISGQLGSFTPSTALPLPIPTSFDASLFTNNPLFSLLGVKCTLDPGSVTTTGGTGTGAGPLSVVKQGSKIKAKGKKSIRKGQKAVIKVRVKTTAGLKGVGSVTAKVRGAKTVTKVLRNGKVRLVFKGLKVGRNKVKITFLGNDYTNGSKKKYTVRVSR